MLAVILICDSDHNVVNNNPLISELKIRITELTSNMRTIVL